MFKFARFYGFSQLVIRGRPQWESIQNTRVAKRRAVMSLQGHRADGDKCTHADEDARIPTD